MERIVQAGRKQANNYAVQGTVQQWCAERHLGKHNSSVLVTDGLLQPDNHTRYHFYQLKTLKKQLQWTCDHQHCTIQEWKNIAWSDKSLFLLRHADRRVRIWRKKHESMDPSCLLSSVQAGGERSNCEGPIQDPIDGWCFGKDMKIPSEISQRLLRAVCFIRCQVILLVNNTYSNMIKSQIELTREAAGPLQQGWAIPVLEGLIGVTVLPQLTHLTPIVT